MKRKSIIGFCCLLGMLCCACSKPHQAFTPQNAPHHFEELHSIAEQMNVDVPAANEALKELASRPDFNSWSDLDQNEWMLYFVESQYKTRSMTTESPDLTPVLAFYDSLAAQFGHDDDLQFLLAKSLYYKGAQESLQEQPVSATKHYLRALMVMTTQVAEGDPVKERFTALTHTRLGEILYYYGLNALASESFQDAYLLFMQVHDTSASAAMLRNLGAIYQANKDYDKALAEFKKAEDMYHSNWDYTVHSVGALLFGMMQYDSAAICLEQSFENGDRFARADAAAKLSEIYRNKGDLQKEMLYTRYYVGNSLNESNLASDKMEIEFLCKQADEQLQNSVAETDDSDKVPIGWLLLVLLLFLAVLAYIIMRNRNRISHIEKQIVTIEAKHKQENLDKDKELESVTLELDQTRQKLEHNQKVDFDMAWEGFVHSPVCEKIRQSVEGKDIMIKSASLYPELKLKELDFIDLVRALNSHFPDISSQLLKDYPALSTNDLRYCALALLGLNDAEIAALEGISYSGVNRRTRKIQSVMQTEESVEHSLLNYMKNKW